MNKSLFILLLIIIFIIITAYLKIYTFFYLDYFNLTDTNLFFYKLPNIYYTKQFVDNLFVPEQPKKTSLHSINFNSYINSDIISNEIICSSINNQVDCWNNNNCQWNKQIDVNNNDIKSFCSLSPKYFP